ncbi:MAG: hypothetical protein ACRDT4_01690 [Micromonosporaceae bacterium]
MSTKAALARLIGELEGAGITIDPDIAGSGLSRTSRQLAEFEFKIASPCGDVVVWLDANGGLRELIIADGAHKRHDHREMAALIVRTIKLAEGVMRDAVTELTRRQIPERGRS